MNRLPLAVFLAAALLLPAAHAQTNAPVLAIYAANFGLMSTNRAPRVVALLWSDGRAIWSESSIQGGPPYRRGSFDATKLNALFDKMEGQGAFTNAALQRAWFGPDSSYTTISIDDGRRRLKLRSWHELYERTNTVATARGLESLGARNRAEVLDSQPAEYRQFRDTWSEIRQAVAAVIPPNGEPFEGNPADFIK